MLIPFRSKQPATFDELVRPHLDHLYRLAYRYTGSVSDAEDLVQDLLVKLYPRVNELQVIEQLRPWLARVLYRIFIDNFRRQSRSPVHLVSTLEDSRANGVDLEDVAAPDDNPEMEVARTRSAQHLGRVIDQLSEEHRSVIMLHDVEGFTLDEMQTILDCPTGTLKSRLHRARNRLRDLLSDGTF
jgi:RNA polymerase sigma factor (sigma-70 family)